MGFAFGPGFLPRLLALPRRLARSGTGRGGGGTKSRGGRLEFQEHRPYQPPDELRDLDWSVFLRHDLLMTKLYEEAKSGLVLVVLDRSASMGGEGRTKDRLCREVAAGLLYAGLATGASAELRILAEGGPVTLGRLHHPRRVAELLRLLEGLGPPSGPTHLHRLRHLPPPAQGGRAAFLLSDFATDEALDPALAALGHGAVGGGLGFVILREERTLASIPRWARRIRDPETGEVLDLPRGEAWRDAFRGELDRVENLLAARARAAGLRCVGLDGGEPFEAAVAALVGA
jgi:uncharacterized protein (DUF58 family)